MSPSALTLFPVSNAWDGYASRPAVFGTAQANSALSADLNLLLGEFETSDQTSSWSSVIGTVTISATSGNVYSGTYSAYFFADLTEGSAYQDVTVRSGEELNFFGATATESTGSEVRIRNRQTGRWLKDDGTWSTSTQYVLASASSSWVTMSLQFNVEDQAVCLTETVTLRVYLHAQYGTSWFDQIELWPSVNWCSVHGHNIPPAIVPTLQYSNDGSSWSDQSTMTLQRDSFYVALDALEAHRYWRILLDGEPDALMYVGETILGQHADLIHNPAYGSSLKWHDRQTRLESDMGESFVHLHNQTPQRSLALNFTQHGSTQYHQIHKTMFRASRGGSFPICIAPVDYDPSVVILGRVRDVLEFAKATPYERSTSLEIIESPLPNATRTAYITESSS
jgi:hypothetical protein